MNKITLENFRCFREKQEARLAPLTLLVGENSTGKTSFLALVRALWDVAFREVIPDFKEEPYDLGTFDEIVYYRGLKSGRGNSFVVGFDTMARSSLVHPIAKDIRRHFGLDTKTKGGLAQLIDERIRPPFDFGTVTENGLIHHEVTFQREGAAPVPVTITARQNDIWVENDIANGCLRLRFDAPQDDEWVWKNSNYSYQVSNVQQRIPSLTHSIWQMLKNASGDLPWGILENKKTPNKTMTDKEIERLGYFLEFLQASWIMPRPFASAPVRSKPRRTYDPARPTSDPEGMGVPMYLAEMHFHGGEKWDWLRNALNRFGKDAGLFDEITVKRFAPSLSSPFQLQIKKYGNKAKGPWRNLIDVGYGVSQVLPIITELFRPDGPKVFLAQQPEVHLHPSAQAALGSLFCELAESSRQLVVETHSDYLLDRVRMGVRDGKSKLKPEDVSILFFERGDLDVNIHSLALDQDGQVIDPPPGYRKFFMEEMNRRLKI